MIRPDITWRGLTLGGDGPYRIQTIDGWEDLPGGRSSDVARSRSHGAHPGIFLASSRVVTVKGILSDPDNAGGAVLALQEKTPLLSEQLDELTITSFGRSLTAFARVERRSIPQDIGYGFGTHEWVVQWTAPDPLRYGPVQTAVSTGLPTSAGGLVYPIVYPLTYGTSGNPGLVTLTNTGTAAVGFDAVVTGSLPLGFQVSSTDGQRLRYEAPVGAGETLYLSTSEGTLLAEGTADRRSNLTVTDWIQVPALSSVTLLFASLGGTYDPAATLTIPGFRSASW